MLLKYIFSNIIWHTYIWTKITNNLKPITNKCTTGRGLDNAEYGNDTTDLLEEEKI